jgi:hypothetical protein
MRSKNFSVKQGATAVEPIVQIRTANGKLGFEFVIIAQSAATELRSINSSDLSPREIMLA